MISIIRKRWLLIIFIACHGYYQDIFVNGKIIEHGERSCMPTWQLIDKFLENYTRPITVLDLGAAQGFYSFNISYKYDATCVMMECSYDYTGHVEKLFELCQRNTADGIIFLNEKVTPETLTTMGKSEHFDVILALNFIHHSGQDYIALTDAICSLGDYVIVENPPAEEYAQDSEEYVKRKYIENTLLARGGIILGYVPRHTTCDYQSKVILVPCKKDHIIKRHIFWPLEYGVNELKEHRILSNFSTKNLEKITLKTGARSITPWKKGINLVTFKFFNGIFPSTYAIRTNLAQNSATFVYDDLVPANLIIQGSKLAQIDIEIPDAYKSRDEKNCALQLIIQFIRQPNKELLRDFYHKVFVATE